MVFVEGIAANPIEQVVQGQQNIEVQLGDQPGGQFMNDRREAELLRGQLRLSACPQQHHLAQHVADQRHIQLRLHSRLTLREPVPHVQRVLEVAEEDLNSPSKTINLCYVLWGQLLVDQVGHVAPPGAVLLADLHHTQDHEVVAAVHASKTHQLVSDPVALPLGVQPAQVLVLQASLQRRDEIAPGVLDLPPQLEAAVAPVDQVQNSFADLT